MKRKPWTERDELFLIDNRNKMSLEELAIELERTQSAIKSKLGKLGYKKRTVYPDDITGKTFGLLMAYKQSERRSGGARMWWCKCQCGKDKEIRGSDLRAGKATSCGCRQLDGSNWDYITKFKNKRFGKLVALERTNNREGKNYKWLCKCDCGKLTEVSTGSLTNGYTKSCGCQNELQLKGRMFGKLTVIKRLEEKSGSSYKWLCKCECGNYSTPSGTSLTQGATRSCGCLSVGVNSHFYKPELSDEDRIGNRYTLFGGKIYVWRKEVYERDSYTCQLCQSSNNKLNAHHLNSWNWAVEERFDVDNGITLCVDCHRNFHKEYGRGDNTKEQFEEFAQMEVAK